MFICTNSPLLLFVLICQEKAWSTHRMFKYFSPVPVQYSHFNLAVQLDLTLNHNFHINQFGQFAQLKTRVNLWAVIKMRTETNSNDFTNVPEDVGPRDWRGDCTKNVENSRKSFIFGQEIPKVKRIQITNMIQSKIYGVCANSFDELQRKGKERFKDHNDFLIRMKTGDLIENDLDFDALNSEGEMVKTTSMKPMRIEVPRAFLKERYTR